MKKLLVLALVLSVATMANAALSLSLVNNGDGTANIVQTGTFVAPTDNTYFCVVAAVFPTGGVVGPDPTPTTAYIGGDPASGYVAGMIPEGFDGIWGEVGQLVASGTANIAGGTYFSGITFTGETSLYLIAGDWGSVTFVNSIVPEPMTMGLLGLGGLFLRRRSK